jgi:glycosyltransferase involved in cell wall biosynthesis
MARLDRAKISATVITYNEQANIGQCLESIRWVDEIVVVDSGSTDRTVEIARNYTERVIINPWPGYIAQKNFALKQASHEWILCLDADERVTPELKGEIISEINLEKGIVGYYIKRHTYYLGRWINHGGWYPDYKLRLIRKGEARWDGVDPHDKLVTHGKTGYLKGEILHYTYRDFSHQLRVIDRFSEVAVQEGLKRGARFSVWKALLHPPLKFVECYVYKLGFLDGLPGLIIAIASSFYVFVKYIKLWERLRRT